MAKAKTSNGARPTAQRERAKELLLSGRGLPEVADELGGHRATAWRWPQDPVVAAELRARRCERREAVADDLAEPAGEALAVLRGLLLDEEAPLALRLRAACAVLDRLGLSERGALEAAGADVKTGERIRDFRAPCHRTAGLTGEDRGDGEAVPPDRGKRCHVG